MTARVERVGGPVLRVAGRAAILVMAGMVAGCASSGEDGRSTTVAGCYQFERTAESRELGLPWGVDLFDIALEGATPEEAPTRHEARTRLSPERVSDTPFDTWWRTAGDSVRIAYSRGGSTVLSLVHESRRLVGTGRAVGDAVALGQDFGPRDPVPVVAHAVVCPPVDR